ncbi:MAG TPA: hypothetical protein VEZ55_06970, partial [Chitinophagaceae bacterium]|nr:hypothetical protein [Chitinophagaceae bacterium]
MPLTNVSGSPLEFDAVINQGDMLAQIRQIEARLKGLTGAAEKEASAIEKVVKNSTSVIAGFASFAAATNIINDIILVRGEFQKLEAVLTNSLGDKLAATEALKMISEYAATTPFQLQELGAAYVKLVNQGIKPTKAELQSLGDLAASTGKGFDQLSEAIIDAQTGEFERLKEFGIRASKEGDRVAFTFKGVKKEVDFTTDAIKDYIISLGRLEGVSGATAAISATIEGQLSNMADAWSRLLNEIGQANEGSISTVISSLTTLIDNFESVVDILKILAATYGTYKAAVIATTAIQAIQTASVQGYTIAEQLRLRAMLISEAAMKLLNRTMLANPAVFLVTSFAALAAALYYFGGRAAAATKAQEALNDVQAESQRIVEKEKRSLQDLLKIALDETRSKQDREAAIRRINEISPEYLGNITLETIRTNDSKKAIDEYIESLDRKARAQAAQSALDKLYQDRIEAQTKQGFNLGFGDKVKAGLTGTVLGLSGTAQSLISQSKENTKNDIKDIDAQINAIKNTYKGDLETQLIGEGQKQGARKRTIEVIEDELKAAQDLQKKHSSSSKEYLKYQTQINALEKEREAITGKQAAKSAIKADKDLDRLKNKLEQLLQSIAAAERDATQSGLLKEQSEIDKINERYDDLIRQAKEFKNNAGLLSRIEAARNKQIDNTVEKQKAEDYKKSVDDQKKAFDKLEEYKATVGLDKAKDLLKDQTGEFDSYIAYLKSELEKFRNDASIGGQIKFKFISEQLTSAEKEATEKEVDKKRKSYEELLKVTSTFNQRREAINKYYNELERELEDAKKKGIIQNADEILKGLRANRAADLEDLENAVLRSSELYRKLGADTIGYSRERLKKELKDLEAELKNGSSLTPEMELAVRQRIEQLRKLLRDTDKATTRALNTAAAFQEAGNALGAMVSSLGDADETLKRILSTLSLISISTAQVIEGIDKFNTAQETNDIAGMVSAGSGIFSAVIAVATTITRMIDERNNRQYEARQAELDFQ